MAALSRNPLTLIVLTSCLTWLPGCGSGSDQDGPGGPVTLEVGDEWRGVGVGIDDDSTWFFATDLIVEPDRLGGEMVRISDQGPPEGSPLSIAYANNPPNGFTVTNAMAGVDSVGWLSSKGVFLARDRVLTGGEGSMQVGIRQSDSAGTLMGDFWAAMIHSDVAEAPDFFSGWYRVGVDSEDLDFSVLHSDRTLTDYSRRLAYDVTDGTLTVTSAEAGARDLVGAVRGDGELFTLVDTHGTPAAPDNGYKSLFIGVQWSTNASDGLLEGTWDTASTCSDNDGSGWGEGASVVVLDAQGSGTLRDLPDEPEKPIEIDLAPDGTFQLGPDIMGAVTPSGDALVTVYPRAHSIDGDYCLTVGIKRP